MGGVFLNFFFLFHLSYIIQQTLSSYTAPLYIIFSFGYRGKDCGCRFHIELWPHTGPEKDILSQQTSSYNNDKKRDLVKGWMQFHFFKINSVFFFVPVMSTKGGGWNIIDARLTGKKTDTKDVGRQHETDWITSWWKDGCGGREAYITIWAIRSTSASRRSQKYI